VLAVLTKWDEFKALDFAKIHGLMTRPAVVFDGRNILDLARLRPLGFHTYGIGQSA
jgi:UDPglucose 6-dehydrogenase